MRKTGPTLIAAVLAVATIGGAAAQNARDDRFPATTGTIPAVTAGMVPVVAGKRSSRAFCAAAPPIVATASTAAMRVGPVFRMAVPIHAPGPRPLWVPRYRFEDVNSLLFC